MFHGAMIHLKKAIRLKNGILFQPGEAVQLVPVPVNPTLCEIQARGIRHRVHYFRLFDEPRRSLVAAWIARNHCKSVIGNPVKPGSCDEFGFPCWSLVYQMLPALP